MKYNTAIVIVNYYSSDFIIDAINIFHKMPFNIFIIDNSCDYSEHVFLEKIKLKNENINIIFNSENIGFGPALSSFVEKYGNYNSYTFVNPDIADIHTKKFKKQLELFLKSDYCFFQPLIIDDLRKEKSVQGISNTTAINVFFEYTLFKFLFRRRTIIAQKIKKDIVDIFIPSGAFFTIKKSALSLIDGFPDTTFLYFEEWLIASRIKKRNYSPIGYIDSNIIVKHIVGGSTKHKFGISNKNMNLIRLKSFIKVVNENFKYNFFIKIIIYLDFLIRISVSLILKTYVKLKG